MNKKNIFYWALYGFGKDIVIVAFALYFSQWLVLQNKVSDLWYNLIFVGASILLFCSAPVFAIVADKRGRALPYLRFMAVALFIVTMASSLFAVFSNHHQAFVLLAALSFLLSEYFYQFSLIFHNAFIEKLAARGKQGFISGLGYTANWLGQIAGIFITLPIIAGSFYLFGEVGRAQTFVPTTVIFFVLALPMLLLFKEGSTPQAAVPLKINYKEEFKNLIRSFKRLIKFPGVGRFLLAFFFYNDAILTIENNFAIYLQRVFNASDQTKSFLLLGVLITTAIGSLSSGWIADKVGLKKSLMTILVFLVALFPLLGLAGNFKMFAVLAIFLGIFYGASLTVARAILAYLAPKDEVNHTFTYYSIVERFATFVGPVSWGLVLVLLQRYGIWNYKIAIIVMGLFILLGTLIIRKIPSDKAGAAA
jgi:UMF1 family MFS transporter